MRTWNNLVLLSGHMKVENLVIARYYTSILLLTQEYSIISNLAYVLINSLYIWWNYYASHFAEH